MKVGIARFLVGIATMFRWLIRLALVAFLIWMLWMLFGPAQYLKVLFPPETLGIMGIGILASLITVGLIMGIFSLFEWARRTKDAADEKKQSD